MKPPVADAREHGGRPGWGTAAWAQVGIAGAIGVAVALAVSFTTPVNAAYGCLLGGDVAVAIYTAWIWSTSWRMDADATARSAVREDPSRPIADVILLAASVASLVAVILTIAGSSHSHGGDKALRVALGVASIALFWFLVHTVFTLKYAREYHANQRGGIDFNTEDPPVWSDFAYLALTIGMTFQVSDTNIRTSPLRRLAMRHALLSFLFGAVIIATTINLVAGLNK